MVKYCCAFNCKNEKASWLNKEVPQVNVKLVIVNSVVLRRISKEIVFNSSHLFSSFPVKDPHSLAQWVHAV